MRKWTHYPYRTWHVLKTLCELARTKSIDAIQIRDMPLTALVAIWLSRRYQLPVYYWMSFPIPRSKVLLARERKFQAGALKYFYPLIIGKLGSWSEVLVTKWCDHLFVQSDRMLAEQVAMGIPAAKMTVVPMGVDWERLTQFLSSRPSEPMAGNSLKLIYMGTMDRSRRIEVLLAALNNIREQFPKVHLILAGDTADVAQRAFINDEINRLQLSSHVTYTGWLPMESAWELASQSIIGLSPYPRGELLDSASPTKTIEYMAIGLPVVANDQPDQRTMLQLSGAGLSGPYDTESMTKLITELLQNPAKRQAMGNRGPEWVKRNRTYDIIGRELALTYHSLLNNECQQPSDANTRS